MKQSEAREALEGMKGAANTKPHVQFSRPETKGRSPSGLVVRSISDNGKRTPEQRAALRLIGAELRSPAWRRPLSEGFALGRKLPLGGTGRPPSAV